MADRTFKLQFDGDASKAGQAVDAVEGKLGGLGKSMSNVGKIAGGVAIGAGLAQLPGFLMGAAKAAAEDEAATMRLEKAVDNYARTLGDDDIAQANKEILGDIDERIKAGQKLAFTDDDIRDSLQSLLAATGDYGEATKRQAAAFDLARGAGIPLATATKMLGKLNEENIEVFKKLGIVVGDSTSELDAFTLLQGKFDNGAKLTKVQAEAFTELGVKTKEGERGVVALAAAQQKLDGTTKLTDKQAEAMKKLGFTIAGAATEADVLAAVQEKFGGQADTYAKSTAGQFESAKIQLGEVKESIGAALIPVIVKLAPIVLKVVEALSKMSPAVVAIVLGVAALIPVVLPVIAMFASLAPLLAGPVGAALLGLLAPIAGVIAALAAVIAIGVLVWKNWDTIKDRAGDLAEWVTTAFGRIADFIGGFFHSAMNSNLVKIALLFTPAGPLMILWHFKDEIVAALQGLGEALAPIFRPVMKLIGGVADAIGSVIDAAKRLGMGSSSGDAEKARAKFGITADTQFGSSGGGEFDEGGVVGGPRGSRQVIVAHGGETILPTHKGGMAPSVVHNHFHFAGSPLTTEAEIERLFHRVVQTANARGGAFA